jgi:signal transduction histidine kinase
VREASVRLWTTGGSVYAEIGDAGRGFDPPPLIGPDATELPAHIGLRGMRDRVALVGGRLSVESRLGGGTRVRAEVPVGG